MILDLLGLDKKMATWICAAIVSVSLLTTTIVWAKTYYDIRADAIAVVEAAKEKKDAVGEAFNTAENATRTTLGKTLGVFQKLTPANATAMLEEAKDQRLCVTRPLTEETECGPHVFDNKTACEEFKKWLHWMAENHPYIETDPHKVNTYECKVIE